MPVTPSDILALILIAVALLVVPSLLAFALFSLSRTPPNSARGSFRPRHSPRRWGAKTSTVWNPNDRISSRRFPDR